MRVRTTLLLSVLALAITSAGCAGAGASSRAGATVTRFEPGDPPSASRDAGPRVESPDAASSASASAASRCQPFCHDIAGACRRPAIGEPEYAMIQIRQGIHLASTDGRTGPHEACDPRCCASRAVGPDPDFDGIMADDRCPNDPEDRDGFDDHDGCPDSDNDGDGVRDVDDRCPYGAEDRDGVEDEDGCRE